MCPIARRGKGSEWIDSSDGAIRGRFAQVLKDKGLAVMRVHRVYLPGDEGCEVEVLYVRPPVPNSPRPQAMTAHLRFNGTQFQLSGSPSEEW